MTYLTIYFLYICIYGSAGLISGPKMAKNQRFLWAIAAQGPKRTFKVSLTGQNCAPNDFSQRLVNLVLLIHHIGPAWLQSWPGNS